MSHAPSLLEFNSKTDVVLIQYKDNREKGGVHSHLWAHLHNIVSFVHIMQCVCV